MRKGAAMEDYKGWTNYETWAAQEALTSTPEAVAHWQTRAWKALIATEDGERAAALLASEMYDSIKAIDLDQAGLNEDTARRNIDTVNFGQIAGRYIPTVWELPDPEEVEGLNEYRISEMNEDDGTFGTIGFSYGHDGIEAVKALMTKDALVFGTFEAASTDDADDRVRANFIRSGNGFNVYDVRHF